MSGGHVLFDPFELTVVLLVVLGLLWALWWCVRHMRASRVSTWDLCGGCGDEIGESADRCRRCGWVRQSRAMAEGALDVRKMRETVPDVRVRAVKRGERNVMLYSTEQKMELDLLQVYLRRHGIRSRRSVTMPHSEWAPMYYLHVSADDAAEARRLVEAVRT